MATRESFGPVRTRRRDFASGVTCVHQVYQLGDQSAVVPNTGAVEELHPGQRGATIVKGGSSQTRASINPLSLSLFPFRSDARDEIRVHVGVGKVSSPVSLYPTSGGKQKEPDGKLSPRCQASRIGTHGPDVGNVSGALASGAASARTFALTPCRAWIVPESGHDSGLSSGGVCGTPLETMKTAGTIGRSASVAIRTVIHTP